MAFVYAVLGGGRQGTAVAYDMARFGDASRVLIADVSLEAAQKSAARVNRLIGKDIAEAQQVDVTDYDRLRAFLSNVDSFLSAALYWHNPTITRAAYRSWCLYDRPGGQHRSGTRTNEARPPGKRRRYRYNPQARRQHFCIIDWRYARVVQCQPTQWALQMHYKRDFGVFCS